jgi:L-cystine transport system permease protein
MHLSVEFIIETLLLTVKAVPVTLEITVISLLLAFPLAFLLAWSRLDTQRKSVAARVGGKLAAVYVSFIRGTPIVLQILIVYSLLPSMLNVLIKRLGLGINVFDINPMIYACAVFALNTSAGLSELLRSSILTVPKGQMEAALSAGLSPVQAWTHIIFPQALVSALPNLSNLTVGLIKNTSLAFIMTVKDITATAKIAASFGYNYIEAYSIIFVLYILLCAAAQILFGGAESWFGRYKHARA